MVNQHRKLIIFLFEKKRKTVIMEKWREKGCSEVFSKKINGFGWPQNSWGEAFCF